MTAGECKIDFEKIKERIKSRPEVECTGKCYGCQAECINRIPEIPEKALSALRALLFSLEVRKTMLEKK